MGFLRGEDGPPLIARHQRHSQPWRLGRIFSPSPFDSPSLYSAGLFCRFLSFGSVFTHFQPSCVALCSWRDLLLFEFFHGSCIFLLPLWHRRSWLSFWLFLFLPDLTVGLSPRMFPRLFSLGSWLLCLVTVFSFASPFFFSLRSFCLYSSFCLIAPHFFLIHYFLSMAGSAAPSESMDFDITDVNSSPVVLPSSSLKRRKDESPPSARKLSFCSRSAPSGPVPEPIKSLSHGWSLVFLLLLVLSWLGSSLSFISSSSCTQRFLLMLLMPFFRLAASRLLNKLFLRTVSRMLLALLSRAWWLILFLVCVSYLSSFGWFSCSGLSDSFGLWIVGLTIPPGLKSF